MNKPLFRCSAGSKDPDCQPTRVESQGKSSNSTNFVERSRPHRATTGAIVESLPIPSVFEAHRGSQVNGKTVFQIEFPFRIDIACRSSMCDVRTAAPKTHHGSNKEFERR